MTDPSQRSNSASFTPRRRFLQTALGSAAAGAPLLSHQLAQAEDVWEIVKYQEREYVTASSVHVFYRFQKFTRDEKDLVFRSSNSLMKWTVGSQSIFINNIRFNLSYPIVEQNKKVLVSRVDLQKLLDPVLRPWYIKTTQQFDTVTIDAGHGGHDSGANGKHGLEKDYALDLALRLSKTLKKLKLKTHLTRDKDVFITLPNRVKIANEVDDSIFVSIHFNHGGTGTASGIETYALAPQGTSSTNDGTVSASKFEGNQRDGENIALATAVHAMVMAKIETEDRGIRRARFNVLRGINKPSILFEGGFVTNFEESKRIDTELYREKVAQAMAGGIMNFRNALKG
ncbi:MAG: N-acetylmuramoyl-L-alanine amidase [Verrucomicrobiales bacterium]|jgi:N-acetylmuramoyl-L-alanine amidase